jgi:hypothetical protein
MKKILIFSVAAAIFFSCKPRDAKTAGEQTVNAAQDTANFTSIQWIDSTFKELGTVTEGPEVEVAYKFRNSGDKPLVISDVHPTCGCTITEKPTEPYSPGEEGTIKAKFTTSGHVGNNDKTIIVTANTKGGTQQELRFHIVVEKGK